MNLESNIKILYDLSFTLWLFHLILSFSVASPTVVYNEKKILSFRWFFFIVFLVCVFSCFYLSKAIVLSERCYISEILKIHNTDFLYCFCFFFILYNYCYFLSFSLFALLTMFGSLFFCLHHFLRLWGKHNNSVVVIK